MHQYIFTMKIVMFNKSNSNNYSYWRLHTFGRIELRRYSPTAKFEVMEQHMLQKCTAEFLLLCLWFLINLILCSQKKEK